MAVEFQSSEKHDSDFIRLVSSIVEHTINQIRPVEVFIIQIDNWFDHKWLEFSGKGIVYFDSSGLRGSVDAALDEFRQDKITFPPFTPNRVVGHSVISFKTIFLNTLKAKHPSLFIDLSVNKALIICTGE